MANEYNKGCLVKIIVVIVISAGCGALLYRGCFRGYRPYDRYGCNLIPDYSTPVEVLPSPEVTVPPKKTPPTVTTPPGWDPFGGSVAEPEVTETPYTGPVPGSTSTPVEPEKPKDPWNVPPGILGEGGDVRDLIPDILLPVGPYPGSEACGPNCDIPEHGHYK